MNFQTSEITLQIANAAKDFSQQYIRPHVMEWDESQEFPVHVFKELGKLGMMGVLVPEEYGGAGMSYYEYKVIIEEISKVCGSIGLSVAAHNSLCTGHILKFANEEQRKKYLPEAMQET
jgi:alkylation response protein AidB-like acyl-CoA dehydrogenase